MPPQSMTFRTSLSPEEQLLVSLTRQQLSAAHRHTVLALCHGRPIDWHVVYATAVTHRVAPLIAHHLASFSPQELRMPAPVRAQLQACLLKNVAVKRYRAQQLARALAFFQGRGLEVMLLKGAVLDVRVYTQPWYTMSDDVDLLLRRRREELVPADREAIDAFMRQHRAGLPSLEIGYGTHADVTMLGTLPIAFAQIWQDAQQGVLYGQTVWIMAPEDLLLAACINGARKRFFKLKALCDIAETIQTFPYLDWPTVIQKARTYGCAAIVYAALVATQLTVGCALPSAVLEGLAVRPAKKAVIRYLCRRRSFTSLTALYDGWHLYGHPLGPSLLLLAATYSWAQRAHYLGVVASRMARYASRMDKGKRAWQLPFPR